MSHFVVGVIMKKEQSLEDLLAPYQENNGNGNNKFVEFLDRTEEVLEEYENRKDEYKNHNIEDFVDDWFGYEKYNGKYGYWENPNAKWDWYQIGGRWNDSIKLKDGKVCNNAKISDIDFSIDMEVYDKQIRFWELYIEKQEPQTEEEKEIIRHTFYKELYYTNRFKSKEEYAESTASFSTYAVVTPDGKWHSKGEMGWFGFSDEDEESVVKWSNLYYDTFMKPYNEDYILVIVDCHI